MRSLLFIPADDERKLGKGVGVGADALILDLEDSVSAARKAAARALAAQYIAGLRAQEPRPLIYVRINALDTSLWQDDVSAVIGARPDGVLLPKSASGEDVHKLSVALHLAEESANAPTGATRIIALAAETPASVLQLSSYLGASARLEGLTWGAEDLAAALGARSNREADGRTYHALVRFRAVTEPAQAQAA
jgi:citrate lyase subunit beta/citryl-CoA lyase